MSSKGSKKKADDNSSKKSGTSKVKVEEVKPVGNPTGVSDNEKDMSVNYTQGNVNEGKHEVGNSGNKVPSNLGSTRSYLEQTVVNAVMQGMSEVAKERPNNPLEFLGNYLIEKSKEQ